MNEHVPSDPLASVLFELLIFGRRADVVVRHASRNCWGCFGYKERERIEVSSEKFRKQNRVYSQDDVRRGNMRNIAID